MTTASDVYLGDDGLEFVKTTNSESMSISLRPVLTPNLDDTASELNVLGLFVDDGSTEYTTGFTSSFTVTPTLHTDRIVSIDGNLNIDSVLQCNTILCNSIQTTSSMSMNSLTATDLVSKKNMIDYVAQTTYDKDHVDLAISTLGTFQENLTIYQVPTVFEVASQIETYVNNAPLVLTTDVPTLIEEYNLTSLATVFMTIDNAFLSHDFTPYVLSNSIPTLIDEYNSNKKIPDEERVGQLIESAAGTLDGSGFATHSFVTNQMAEISTIVAGLVTIDYFNDQLSTLGNGDDASVGAQLLNLTHKLNDTYTRSHIDDLLSNVSTLSIEDVQSEIASLPTSEAVSQSIQDELSAYTTQTLQPMLGNYTTYSYVDNRITEALSNTTSDVTSTSLETAFNTYTLNVLNSKLAIYPTVSEVQTKIDTAVSGLVDETGVLQLLTTHEYPTVSEVQTKIDTAVSGLLDDTAVLQLLTTHEYVTQGSMDEAFILFSASTLPDYLSDYVSTDHYETTLTLSLMANVNATITSALHEYTETTLLHTLTQQDIDAKITQYIVDDPSQKLLTAVKNFIDGGNLDAKLHQSIEITFATKAEVEANITAMEQKFVTQSDLENDYYSKYQLFTDPVCPVLSCWLDKYLDDNSYVTQGIVDGMLEAASTEISSNIKGYVLEQLANVGSIGGGVSLSYLQDNYLSSADWFLWIDSDSVSANVVQQMIDTSTINLEDTVVTHTTDIESLVNRTANIESSLSNVNDQIDTFTANVEANIETLSGEITTVSTELGGLKSNLETFGNVQSVLQLSLEDATSNIVNLTARCVLIETNELEAATRFESIETNVTNLMTNNANIEFVENHFVSHEDWTTHLNSNCSHASDAPLVNLYNFNVTRSVQPVLVANSPTDVISVEERTDGTGEIYYEIKCNDLESATLDGLQLDIDKRPRILLWNTTPEYNGIYVIWGIRKNIVKCDRASDFNTCGDMLNTMIVVRRDDPSVDSVMNGSVFVTLDPCIDTDADSFELNTSPVNFMQVTRTDFATMAFQYADNVSITGGSVAVDTIAVDTIKPNHSSTVELSIPDTTASSMFKITAFDAELSETNTVFQVDGTGTASCTQFVTLSDRSLKQNDKTIDNPLHLTSLLNGKTFDWIDESKNTNGPSYGFIAQEVQDNFPSLVKTGLNNKLGVDYAKVVAILVESVKQLHKHVVDAGLVNSTEHYTASRDVYTASRDVQTTSSDVQTTSSTPAVDENHTCPTHVTQNVVGLSAGTNAQSVVVNLATTEDDTIGITYHSLTGCYSMFINSGLNTIDGVQIQIGHTLLVKDHESGKFNGVYRVDNIQTTTELGVHSIASRWVDQRSFDTLGGSLVFVQADDIYTDVGRVNNGRAFVGTVGVPEATSFELDVTPIAYVAFDGGVKSMAYQRHDDVNITGGNMELETLTVDVIQPPENSSEITIQLNGATNADKFVVRDQSNNNNEVFSVDGTGIATCLDCYNPSDERLKRNVHQIADPLQLVHGLRGVTFDWINKSSDDPQYGFIAQEVAVRFPSLVHTRADGLLAVDYSKVVTILVECVKELTNLLSF